MVNSERKNVTLHTFELPFFFHKKTNTMKKSNLIFALFISLIYMTSCTQPTTNNATSSNDDLKDIVEIPPQKKVNQAPVPAKNKKHITTGVFSEIEKGDYVYLHMKDEKNKDATYTIWRAYEGAADLNVDNWKSVKGKKIKVTWDESKELIQETGETMTIKKVLAIEVL